MNGQRQKNWLCGFLSLPALLLLATPLLALIFQIDWHQAGVYVCCPLAVEALHLSLLTTGVSVGIILLLGLPLAFLLSQPFRQRNLLDTIVDLPIVLPPAVAGVALLVTFGRNGLVGQYLNLYGLTIPFTTIAVIVAQIFVALPFFVKQARAGFEAVDARLLAASSTLGASSLRTFFKVSLPLSYRALLAGLVMAWARALGEFGATLMFAGNLPKVTQTMPLAIYTAMESNPQLAIALSLTLVGVAFAVLVIGKALAGRRLLLPFYLGGP